MNMTALPTVECVHPVSGDKIIVNQRDYDANPKSYVLWADKQDDPPVETAGEKKAREAKEKEAADKKAADEKAKADALKNETPAEKKAREKKEADEKASGGK